MWNIDKAYIDGAFVPVQGSEVVEVVNPATEQVIGTATLGNRDDARRAIAAANRAQQALRRTGKAERIEMLEQLSQAVLARTDDIRDATIEEYGGPRSRAQWVSQYASQCFAGAAKTLQAYALERRIGEATVVMEPVVSRASSRRGTARPARSAASWPRHLRRAAHRSSSRAN
jgi:aldehyde dehydrogenase (NAD+)